MRISVLKCMIAVICVSAVTVLGAGRAAANGAVCSVFDHTWFLDISGTNLVLDQDSLPAGATTKFIDSPALSRSGGNPYVEIGEWESYIGGTPSCVVDSVSPLQVWLGLRNSDDQGTNFDLKAEVRVSTVLVATAEQLCIKGLTRNPALAQEIIKSFVTTAHPPEGEISLTLYARIGTPQSTCGGHNSATGLRVYYGSDDRDSSFDISFRPSI